MIVITYSSGMISFSGIYIIISGVSIGVIINFALQPRFNHYFGGDDATFRRLIAVGILVLAASPGIYIAHRDILPFTTWYAVCTISCGLTGLWRNHRSRRKDKGRKSLYGKAKARLIKMLERLRDAALPGGVRVPA